MVKDKEKLTMLEPCSVTLVAAEMEHSTRAQRGCLGVYHASEDWSAGRRVYRQLNSGRVMSVRPGGINWAVRDGPERGRVCRLAGAESKFSM